MRILLLPILTALMFVGCDSSIGTRDKPASHPSPLSEPGSRAKQQATQLEKIKQVVATQFNVKLTEIDVDKPLLAYGDELNVIEIVLTLEKMYGVKIPDERFMNKAAVGSVGIHKDLSTTKLAEIVRELTSHSEGLGDSSHK